MTNVTIDLDALSEFAKSHYLEFVRSELGDEKAGEWLRQLIDTVKRVYGIIAPERYNGQLMVALQIGETQLEIDGQRGVSAENVESVVSTNDTLVALSITLSGKCRIWKDAQFDCLDVSESHLVYFLDESGEKFVINRKVRNINVGTSSRSIFAAPTFAHLKAALEDYSSREIRHSTCPLFRDVWFDERRFYFKAKPEEDMRRSLWQFLRACLRRDCDVHQEHPVNETRPVDINVLWKSCRKRAIIEVKWLGRSLKEDKSAATEYTEARAREGANQLAAYLDETKVYDPDCAILGYLVVIDGRRSGLCGLEDDYSETEARKYCNSEIRFDPEHHNMRLDFEVPIRMFAEPRNSSN